MFNISNSVRLIGRLGQDPEVKILNEDRKMARFSVATNESYKNAEGERVENTTWHNLVAWGSKAEFVENYVQKGREVAIEGRLTHRSYVNKDGVQKYITEIVLNEIKLLSAPAVMQQS